MARILLIDDDPALLDVLSLAFEDAGHDVLTAPDGVAGLHQVRTARPDLVVSDVNMPGVDGFSLVRQLREAGNAVPVVLLTSRDTEIDEVLGLEMGADEYLTKPFSTRILLARVVALLRREQLRAGGATGVPVKVGRLELDPERLEVRYAEVLVEVTVTEFRLLEVLARRPGVVYTRDQLMERMRGDDSVVAPRIVDTYIRRVRRKIESVHADFDEIETVVGAGYKWRSGG